MSYITSSKSKTKVTVTERFYDEKGNLTKEVETVTETEPIDTFTTSPYTPYPYTPTIRWSSGTAGGMIIKSQFPEKEEYFKED